MAALSSQQNINSVKLMLTVDEPLRDAMRCAMGKNIVINLAEERAAPPASAPQDSTLRHSFSGRHSAAEVFS
jgi:hypothetical protein